jgi:hypothetical protein
MFGNGVALSFGNSVTIHDCEIARNGLDGMRIAESKVVIVDGCLAEGNGGAPIAQETWMEPNRDVVVKNNTARNNLYQG